MTSQIALPLSPVHGAENIVVGPSLQPVIDGLVAAHDWPYRSCILSGPTRSGKSLLARWFESSGLGDALDGADRLPEDDVFHAWNRAQASGRPLLLVNDAGPGQWRVKLPDLASRLGGSMALTIPPPDEELLVQLLEEHAARRGLALGDAALAFLLPRIERSHAAAQTVVETIDRLSLERKAPVTTALVRDALAQVQGPDKVED
ncbi:MULTISPECIES: ATPase [unclassified Novosphingobium]|uniref:HdaA/DnaA family protein n=1 Tax=unclassified Novosphingobium TaxID=2644732 RepID=UPI00146F5A9B|nr:MULTISPECIES: ATPase [unclassified Novosphingobium]NMN03256.1 chromosomal replication initiation ATPase DnaA [Novosphingobium sp. SG919]NMN86754.1 chromosomal replication initiation ATPase DnaA [Novosphingobium sp. SG916]